jgi:hypothetical protein
MSFLLVLIILLLFFFVELSFSAEPSLVHVDGTYAPSLPSGSPTPSPSPSPTSTATPTNEPTATPTKSPSPTPSPTSAPLNDNPATASPTANPTYTTNPTSTAEPTSNPTETTQPTPSSTPIPELTTLIIATAIALITALAIYSKKNAKSLLGVAALTVVLTFSLMPSIVNGQATPTASPTPIVSYSLWFTNGTVFPTDGSNSNGYVNGGPYLNVGGIHCIAQGFGSSAEQMTNVVVLRNDGNVPINIDLALKNVVAPSNIQISMTYFFMNDQTFQPYCNDWIGFGNVDQNTLDPGQYMWLGITVRLGQTDVPVGKPNYSFGYSFDIEVNAIQA